MSAKMRYGPAPDGYEYIYRPYITQPDGTKLYASQFGKRAFRLCVRVSD
jgi:hypothetical protein